MSNLREVMPSPDERKLSEKLFEKVPVLGAGYGLVARTYVKDGTLVGTYPGVVYPEEEYNRLVRSKHPKLVTYAVEFFKVRPNRSIDRGWIITPGAVDGKIAPRFKDCLTPYINEPPIGKKPNCFWVWNLHKNTIEIHTFHAINRGEPLYLCYGNGYKRNYKTGCTALQGTNNIFALHYKYHGVKYSSMPPKVKSTNRLPPTQNSRKRSSPAAPLRRNAKLARTTASPLPMNATPATPSQRSVNTRTASPTPSNLSTRTALPTTYADLRTRTTSPTPSILSTRTALPTPSANLRTMTPPAPMQPNAQRPRTPNTNAMKAVLISEMRAILDKAQLTPAGIRRVHQLKKMYHGMT